MWLTKHYLQASLIIFLIGTFLYLFNVINLFSQTNTSSELSTKPENFLQSPAFKNDNKDLGTFLDQKPSDTPLMVGFWGDVMLARNVELLSDIEGKNYLFSQISNLFKKNNFNFINFEGTLTNNHQRTKSGIMRFDISKKILPTLAETGITHASLANNHALDYGLTNFNLTKETLVAEKISSFGHPTLIDNNSVTYLNLGKYKLAVLALHTLFTDPSAKDLENIFKVMQINSDFQIVYVHWGDEYQVIHNKAQEDFAKKLVFWGADLIIGHHPHVVQDIQLVDGIPVFYSLGNTIFDQYFSLAVEEGYSVNLSLIANKLIIKLIPFTSVDTHSQPRPMTNLESIHFLTNLAEKSDQTLQANIKQGQPIFTWLLASS